MNIEIWKKGFDDYENNQPVDISLSDNEDYLDGYETASIEFFMKKLD